MSVISIPTSLQKPEFNFVLLKPKQKIPFEQNWQNLEIKFDNEKLMTHLLNDGNYGVIGGGDQHLIIIDFDNEELQKTIIEKLPKTFTVKTGSGLLHKYFASDKSNSFKLLDKDKNTLCDIQGKGKQVVGPNSIHPNGNVYEVVDDSPLAFINYNELKALLMPFDFNWSQQNNDNFKTELVNTEYDNADMFNLVAEKVSIKQVLGNYGVDVSRNPTACPFHDSKGGKCLGFTDTLAHCFHCDDKWNIFSLTKQLYNVDSKTALEKLCEMGNLKDDLQKHRDEWKEKHKQSTTNEIIIPKVGKLISAFATELIQYIKPTNKIFYRGESRDIIEIGTINLNDDNKFTGFIQIKPNRFITFIEQHATPGVIVPALDEDGCTIKGEWAFKSKSISGDLANTVLQCEQFYSGLNIISRTFPIPLPILRNKKIIFPKKGYDETLHSWTPENTITINENLPITEAKLNIEFILSEFCFKDNKDKTNAIAGLITPFLRGLYTKFNIRTPVFFYEANRERAGKDYLAGITGILYEGYKIEEAPISNGESREGTNDELRKKILSAMIMGRKRLHFANNRGYINNAVFEGIITAERYSDRLLGKNEIAEFDNELDFSLSGNIGTTYTPDLANRCKFIRLFLDIENANSRVFKMSNLHEWILINRAIILSSIYALIREWYNKGMPKSSVPFASYPEWADICGGIMESNGYENPCIIDDQELLIGGDTETRDMKKLFELCHTYASDHNLKVINKRTIQEIITNNQENSEAFFNNYDLYDRKSKVRLGILLSKFEGRILSEIRMMTETNLVNKNMNEISFRKIS